MTDITKVYRCSFCGKMRNNMVCCLTSTHNETRCKVEPDKECESCQKLTRICTGCAICIAEADK